MKKLLCLVFLFFGVPLASATTFLLPSPELETLPNGLTIAWFAGEKAPILDLLLCVRSGFRDDPASRAGLANLAATLMDRGTAEKDANTFAHELERLGASRYSTAGADTFLLSVTGLKNDAPQLVLSLAEMALFPAFQESEIQLMRPRLIDGWKHLGDTSESLASFVFYKKITDGTSYSRDGMMGFKELQSISRKDLIKFHSRHFTPQNSVLVVVGGFNKNEVRSAVLAGFSNWKKTPLQKRNWIKYRYKDLQLKPTERGILINRPGLTQAHVLMGFEGPSYKSEDRYALAVGNALFGEYFNSRLNVRLRDELGMTYGVGSDLSYQKDFSYFSIAAATRNETAGVLVREVERLLKELAEGPISKEEVDKAKDFLVGSFPVQNSTLGALASRWLKGIIFELGPDYLKEFIPRVSAVTEQQVMSAVRKHFRNKNLVAVMAGDRKALEESLKAAKSWPWKVLQPDEVLKLR